MSTRFVSHVVIAWGMCVGIGISDLAIADDALPLVVHEWGTFTALHDEHGIQLFGINVDTEPVPEFVHKLGRFILNDAVLSSKHWIHHQNPPPRNHPEVSMRLETPVIYFYPPPGMKLPHVVDVEAKFRGGWLTEFYPRPDVRFPAIENREFRFTDLSPKTEGQIAWRNLKIGTDDPGPETHDSIWLAPRKVDAASVTSAGGEHEKYLFYRGVGRQDAPVRAITEGRGKSLALSTHMDEVFKQNEATVIKNLWLMEARADGACAYRRLPPLAYINDGNKDRRTVVPRRFSDSEFDPLNRSRLEEEMNDVLLKEGLFADEARALLSTWQQAYFVSPGLRLFYTVPREWVDYYLPLTVSGQAKITRVMVGRLELISDSQRDLLDRLAVTPVSNGDWLLKLREDSPEFKALMTDHRRINEFADQIPVDFQMYLALGRFRNALVAIEEKRTKSKNLADFIRVYQLDPFRLSQKRGK